MKKLLSIATIFSFLIFSVFATNAVATDNQEPQQNDLTSDEESAKKEVKKEKKLTKEERKALIEKIKYDKEKVKKEDLEALSDVTLLELMKYPDGEVVSISVTYKDLDKGPENTASIAATMPTSDFKMTVTAQRIYEKGSGYDNFRFVSEGDWIESPFYEYTDTIAIAWSDAFTLYDDESYVVRAQSDGTYEYDFSRSWRNSVENEEGVGHDVDLKIGAPDSLIVLIAKVYKPNSSGTANVKGEYGHLITEASIDLSFSVSMDSPEISMTPSVSNSMEEASPDYASFSY